jgi:hypothetical protein
MPLVLTQVERIQVSAEVIQRDSPEKLGDAANIASLNMAGSVLAATGAVHATVRDFTAELRRFKA